MKHRIVNLIFISLLVLLALLSLFATISAWIFAVVAVVWLGIAAVGSTVMELNYHVRAHVSNPSESLHRIALTFDDGPNENTSAILDILQKHGVKAAFFCIGQHIEKHPEILRRIATDGHVIGNHSHSHSHFFDFFGKGRVMTELRQTDRLIFELTGKRPRFFRPPYGVTNPSIRRALAVTQHVVIGWNIRSMDGVSTNATAILNRILRQLSPGAVILLHDTRTHTAVVLEQLLLTAAEKKLKIVPVDELLNLKAYEN